MGITAVHMKLMPSTPEANLSLINEKAGNIVNSFHKTQIKMEEEPIAFGLKAIHLYFSWNDEIDTERLEAELQKIEEVSSVETLDIRKAFG
jgi:translation elongation factor aEF-1 beta